MCVLRSPAYISKHCRTQTQVQIAKLEDLFPHSVQGWSLVHVWIQLKVSLRAQLGIQTFGADSGLVAGSGPVVLGQGILGLDVLGSEFPRPDSLGPGVPELDVLGSGGSGTRCTRLMGNGTGCTGSMGSGAGCTGYRGSGTRWTGSKGAGTQWRGILVQLPLGVWIPGKLYCKVPGLVVSGTGVINAEHLDCHRHQSRCSTDIKMMRVLLTPIIYFQLPKLTELKITPLSNAVTNSSASGA